jgi:hypothetical protein
MKKYQMKKCEGEYKSNEAGLWPKLALRQDFDCHFGTQNLFVVCAHGQGYSEAQNANCWITSKGNRISMQVCEYCT